MSTLTGEQQDAIREYVMGHQLPSGLGTKEAACSIAAINLALTGELTDDIPDCMSPVIGRWIIGVQDAMPSKMRNDIAWKSLLPLAAGTGREAEAEQKRLAVILDWMWLTVLPSLQAIADRDGFGDAWREMCSLKTSEAAAEAAEASWAAAEAAEAARAARAAAEAARAARAAAEAAEASWAAAEAARAAEAAEAAAEAARAAEAAEAAAEAARAAREAAWEAFAPSDLLRRLIEI